MHASNALQSDDKCLSLSRADDKLDAVKCNPLEQSPIQIDKNKYVVLSRNLSRRHLLLSRQDSNSRHNFTLHNFFSLICFSIPYSILSGIFIFVVFNTFFRLMYFSSFLYCLKFYIITIIISPHENFHTSVSLWCLTGDLVTASLFKSSRLF